jgi:hypothetical protein
MVVFKVSRSRRYQITRSLQYKLNSIERVVKTATEEHDRDKGRRWRMKTKVVKIDTYPRLLCVGVYVMDEEISHKNKHACRQEFNGDPGKQLVSVQPDAEISPRSVYCS